MSLRRHLFTPLMTAAAVIVLAGCGPAATKSSSTTFKGEQATVASVVDDLAAAGKKGDEGKICDQIFATTLKATAATKGGTCKAALKDNLSDADLFGLDVKSVVIKGTTATAVVVADAGKGKPKQTQTFTFVKQGSSWRISSLGS